MNRRQFLQTLALGAAVTLAPEILADAPQNYLVRTKEFLRDGRLDIGKLPPIIYREGATTEQLARLVANYFMSICYEVKDKDIKISVDSIGNIHRHIFISRLNVEIFISKNDNRQCIYSKSDLLEPIIVNTKENSTYKIFDHRIDGVVDVIIGKLNGKNIYHVYSPGNEPDKRIQEVYRQKFRTNSEASAIDSQLK